MRMHEPKYPDTRVAPPAFLDVEASGFGRGSYPIEVGAVLPDGSTFCVLIRPAPGWTHWDSRAERMHGIARETLEMHGRGAREVAQLLNDRLRGQTVLCDAWAHDFVWLGLLFDVAGWVPLFRLEDLRSVLTPQQTTAWHDTRRTVEACAGLSRHRASSDAQILQMTLQRLSTGR
jgi:hypothetical protein